MSRLQNKWTGYGRLGKEIEMRFTSGGTEVVNVSIATEEKRGDEKVTTWIPLTFFGKTAELADRILKKGMKVMVEGKLDVQNKKQEDGTWKTYASVIVNTFDVLDWGKDGSGGSSDYVDSSDVYVGGDDDDEDIPF